MGKYWPIWARMGPARAPVWGRNPSGKTHLFILVVTRTLIQNRCFHTNIVFFIVLTWFWDFATKSMQNYHYEITSKSKFWNQRVHISYLYHLALSNSLSIVFFGCVAKRLRWWARRSRWWCGKGMDSCFPPLTLSDFWGKNNIHRKDTLAGQLLD